MSLPTNITTKPNAITLPGAPALNARVPVAPAAPKAPTLFNLGITTSTSQTNLFGFQGAPNSGKTTSALKFPNPLVLDFDKKLPPGVPSVEFWNPDFVNSITPCKLRPNRRDALKKWLREARTQLTPGVTLILDSYTRVNVEFDLQAEADPTPYLNKSGAVDNFEVYRQKLLYNHTIFELLSSMPCTVVVTFHEQIDRDATGVPTGKMRPLITGQFADQVAGMFANFYRCNCKEDKQGKLIYTWQIRSNNLFNAVRSPAYKFPEDLIEIPAEYSELQKYLQVK